MTREKYMTYTKDDKVQVITPQCKSCGNYQRPLNCEIHGEIEREILLNDKKCEEYLEKK